MVRNGVVSHPSEWLYGGYNEIQNPRKKNLLIAYKKLAELTGFESYTAFRETHKELVNESLLNGNNIRQNQWTESIAVGSKEFIETIQGKLGILAKGRKILENDGGFHLGEQMAAYHVDSDRKNNRMGPENTYCWDVHI